jgi:hypothetical protein
LKPEARWFVVFSFGLFAFFSWSLAGLLLGADSDYCAQTAAMAVLCWVMLISPAKSQGWGNSQTFQLLRVGLVGLFGLLAALRSAELGHLWIVAVLVWVADPRGLQIK